MLRLTLRSGGDGKLLARVVERDGLLFVLDHGDPALVTDASRRVLHGGFTVDWQGRIETALPSTPGLLRQLALYYAARGVLVFVDEPDFPRAGPIAVSPWSSRSSPVGTAGPLPLTASLPTLVPDEPADHECTTVLRSRRELRELQERIDATVEAGPELACAVVEIDDDEDAPLAIDREDEPPTEEARPSERGR